MSFSSTPHKSRPAPGQQGSTPFRSASTSKFRSSLVPMNRPSPARSSHPPSKVTGTSTTGRDLFRTSSARSIRAAQFAPSLPAEATKASPGVRKFAPPKTIHGGMSNAASTEPFKMRIPSPDPDLTGEALSREIPDDPSRKGSVYADQFLAHKCPPDFDDLQRRQFFCILDLRRLKYAADEIFANKDWKLNIMNFAKEYEKSRGLIMLRYGLYEFKNVKPSEDVLKRWRATHGLPDPEPEEKSTTSSTLGQQNRRAGASAPSPMKRKAEDDLAPKDNALMVSTANQNKRRNVTSEEDDPALNGPAPFKKSKRKADATEESDENQPSKLQKSTPSAATSKFESILNKAQSGNASPLKRSAPSSKAQSTPFGTPKSSDTQSTGLFNKSNPFAAASNGLNFSSDKTTNGDSSTGSVLAGHKVGSTPATNSGNIFSYLSESSANSSGNENGNADDDGETESESEKESENQDAAPSYDPSAAASTGTSTPPTQSGTALFPVSKTSNASNIFGSPSKPADVATKGGLFGRVSRGADGQPLRATPGLEEKENTPAATETEQNETPAKQPGDYTFNPATTPISFGQPASNTPKTPATAFNAEPDKGSSKPETTTASKPTSLFGLNNGTSSSLFRAPNSSKPKPAEETPSLFGLPKTTPTSGMFNAAQAKPLFGSIEKANESDSSAPKEQPKSIFGSLSANADVTAEPKPLFGGGEKPGESDSTTVKNGAKSVSDAPVADADPMAKFRGLFGSTPKTDEPKANGSSSSQTSFGSSAKPSTTSLFGTASNATPPNGTLFGGPKKDTEASAGTKSIFGAATKQPSAGFSFGSSKPGSTTEAAKSSNGSDQGTAEKSMFGSEIPKPTGPVSSLFGNKQAPSTETKHEEPAVTKPSSSNDIVPANSSMFNFGAQAAPAPTPSQPSLTQSFTFGAGSNASPAVSFGASNNQTNGSEPKKVDFQFGASNPAPSATPFAFGQDSSSGSGFSFSAGGNGQAINNPFAASNTASSAPVFGGNSSTPTPTPASSFNFSFGQQPPSTPQPPANNQGSGIFGGPSNGTNGGPSFSFTQASPAPNTPNAFGPKATSSTSGIFSNLLQAGGDGPAGASSPFPAPSSMNTTPVNGTPEPQAQNEDGEEAPQEQLTLTDGGPGEEDEHILHEVRAKAIKYVPVDKNGDEDQAKKSPWSTQGVGPLRVLKNKSTGTVRILLRAEPRGHIAMNKTILADIEYKPKDKTLNFATASDDGSCLETWVLQVKKPEFAQQLAAVMEANKGANKK